MQYEPVTGNKYPPLPSHIAKKQAVINIKNNDKKCFLWLILASLQPQSAKVEKVSKYKQYKDEFNYEDVLFTIDPLQHKVLDRFCEGVTFLSAY